METDNGTRVWRWVVGGMGTILLISFMGFFGWVVEKTEEHANFALADEVTVTEKEMRIMFQESVVEQRLAMEKLRTKMEENYDVITSYLIEIIRELPKDTMEIMRELPTESIEVHN